jgi:hypothetical protein
MSKARRMHEWVRRQNGVRWLGRRVCGCGPYLVIELVLPGGTLISLLLYLYRRRIAAQAAARV